MRLTERQCGGFGAPVGMSGEKAGGLARAFLVEQRAGDVDQPPAGADERLGDIEQVPLERGKPIQRSGVEPPPRLGIAAPGAGSGARRVDQHGIRPAVPGGQPLQLATGIEQYGLGHQRPRPLGARCEAGETRELAAAIQRGPVQTPMLTAEAVTPSTVVTQN